MNNRKILIIEDSEIDVLILSHALNAKYDLEFAPSAEVALVCLTKEKFDLILLDVSLPGLGGVEFCERVKMMPAYESTPIIFVSGYSAIPDRVKGLQAGADDYITKPYSVPELLARVETCLRRKSVQQDEKSFLKCGPLTLDFQKHSLISENETQPISVALTSTELKLLSYFFKKPNVIFTRAQIIEAVWEKEVHVLERTVDARVNSLRKKMGQYSNLLNSVHGIGYKLVMKSTQTRAS